MKLNYFTAGGLVLLLSVILGAFGAHYFKAILFKSRFEMYETAVFYQFIHGFALLFLGVIRLISPKYNFDSAGLCFLLGIILFSGSLFILAIFSGNMHWLIKNVVIILTPCGGLFLMAGWVSFLFRVNKPNKY